MSMLYAIGDALVTRDELVEKSLTGDAEAFTRVLAEAHESARLELSTGLATGANIITETSSREDREAIGHEPIGLGKPLTVEIRHIYTGKYPRPVFFDDTKDMLVTSAMKGLEVYDGAPRAVNFLEKGIKRHEPIRYNDPSQPGTPLVFYSPALTQLNSVLKIEVAFAEFPKKIFDILADALRSGASIPVFAPAGAYLLAGGAILNLAGVIGKAAFDSKAEFEERTGVTFDRPGDYPTVADFRLLMKDRHVREVEGDYHVSKEGELVNERGAPYAGDYPYVVLSFDGRSRPAYEGFTATAATADILEGFFASKDIFSTGVELVFDAMKLCNDWKFRQEAIQLNKELKDLKQGDANYAKKKQELTTRRDAAVKNIQKEELKPKF